MSTRINPYHPAVDFCSSQYFGVEYNNQFEPLPCWQRVLIVVFTILGLGIGGLALSYYWRSRMVQQLYTADYQRGQVIQPYFEKESQIIDTSDMASRVDKWRIEIETGQRGISLIGNKNMGQLSGNGRYFIALSYVPHFEIPFSREELPEGIYCVFACPVSRWELRLTGAPIAHYKKLVQDFGADKVYLLAIEQSRVESVWFPENGLVLGLDKGFNSQSIARFKKRLLGVLGID